jgi:hypothetical protein
LKLKSIFFENGKNIFLLFLMQASGDLHWIIKFLTGSGQGGGGAGSKMTLLGASL